MFGLVVGAAIGVESLFPEAMCCGSTFTGILFMFTLPGMIVSGIIVGNIHAFPTWTAAIVNAILYYVLGSALWKFAAFMAKRINRRDQN
jgi:hypothetical protein